ncbi:hypothetical protein [Synechococcus sp. W4D4]|uniref:hypothetical protein n=1 Tax=Synechococcus sp. W4D4 TaxID=3392294 RepID=UPI0039EA63DA
MSPSLNRILEEIGEQTAQELLKFAAETAVLQRNAASAGLRLAIAVFNEAKYLDKHHRFDDDNQYGWRSKRLRKQVQQMVEAVGFKRNNAHKLVATADWLTSRHSDKDEQKWFKTLTPSHIYELSRMSAEGLAAVKKEVSYRDFHFSAGQLPMPVKRLAEIRQAFPKCKEVVEGEHSRLETTSKQLTELQAAEDTDEPSTAELIEQFVRLAQTINWSSIQHSNEAMESLKTIEYTLSHISEALDQWKYASRTYA